MYKSIISIEFVLLVSSYQRDKPLYLVVKQMMGLSIPKMYLRFFDPSRHLLDSAKKSSVMHAYIHITLLKGSNTYLIHMFVIRHT